MSDSKVFFQTTIITKIIHSGNLHGLLLIFILIHIFPFSSDARLTKEKYLVTTNGTRVDFNSLKRLSGDTLFYSHANDSTFILVDSIAEYHYTKPGKGGRGFLIGSSIGLLLGGLIGYAAAPEETNSVYLYPYESTITKGASTAVGGIAGLTLGGVTGLLIGSSQKIDIHIDFRNMDKNKKLQKLFNLIGL